MSQFNKKQQGMTLADLELLVDSMKGRGVSGFELGDLKVQFFYPIPTSEQLQAAAAPVEVTKADEPKVEPEVGADGLTQEEAALAYAST